VPTWPQASLTSGFTYVSDTVPGGAQEGETWYHLDPVEGEPRAQVYDGAEWHRMAVEDHSELSGVSVGQHRSDQNVRATVDGQVDADTVDGQHASEIGTTLGNYHFSESLSTEQEDTTIEQTFPAEGVPVYVNVNVTVEGAGAGDAQWTARIDYTSGDSYEPGQRDGPVYTDAQGRADSVYFSLRIPSYSGGYAGQMSMEYVAVKPV
jgi:uncharacterized protein (DUF427 family)